MRGAVLGGLTNHVLPDHVAWIIKPRPDPDRHLKEKQIDLAREENGELALAVHGCCLSGRDGVCLLAGSGRRHIHRLWRGMGKGGASEGKLINIRGQGV